ncbi:hypothetical protein [Brevibacillus agri]|nr:hypothetical protein [Brevibacillus agri]
MSKYFSRKKGLLCSWMGRGSVCSILSGALMLWGVAAAGTTVYANDNDTDREVGTYSVGELFHDSDSKLPYFQVEKSIQPFSTGVVYKQNGYVRGSIKAEENGYDRDYFLVHKADVELIEGTKITYKFMKTIRKDVETSHSIDTGLRAQGGNRFITELEGHFDYNYVSKERIEYTKGTETNVEVTKPGDYTLYFYAQARVYNLYADWLGYTRDNKTERKLKRYIGDVYEATTFEYIKPKRNR